MLSLRFVAAFALLAAIAFAAPPTDNKTGIPRPVTTITEDEVEDTPWFSFPLFGNLFAPLWRLLPSFGEIGPKIIADDNKFQVIVNVKDYKKDDLKVKVKGDFIFVQGTHEAKHDERDVFASQFFHTYTLPVNSSADDVSADLSSDGFLIVNAPLTSTNDKAKDKDVDREITIVETGVPYLKEDNTTTTKVEKPHTTIVPTPTTILPQKDREPTTPSSDREELTEKNDTKVNDIPHGNEITP